MKKAKFVFEASTLQCFLNLSTYTRVEKYLITCQQNTYVDVVTIPDHKDSCIVLVIQTKDTGNTFKEGFMLFFFYSPISPMS